MHQPERPRVDDLLAQFTGAILLVDEMGNIRALSAQACAMLKYAPQELMGQSIETLVPRRCRMAHIGHRLRFTDDQRTRPMGAGLALFALCKDESEIPVDISLAPLRRGLEALTVVTMQPRAAQPLRPSAGNPSPA